jgi:hypothetical protein
MGGACRTDRTYEKYIQYFGWKTWKEDNIRMDVREIVWEGVD